MNGTTTSILYAGVSFLVQTQDAGPRSCQLETLIYRQGKLVYTRRTSCADLLKDEGREERLKRLIRDQHQAVLDDIAAGHLDVHLLKS
jgi:hypothetical protein